MIGVRIVGRNRLADDLFDGPQIGDFIGVAERQGDTVGARPRRSTDAVDVTLGLVGKFVVDDVADAVDIDAARRDVGRHQGAHPTRLEIGQGLLTRPCDLLPWIASALTPFSQLLGQAVGAELGTGEDDGRVTARRRISTSRSRFLSLATNITRCSTRSTGRGLGRHVDPQMILRMAAPGRLRPAAWWRKTGASTVVPAAERRSSHVVDEAHVEHAVGLVEDEGFNRAQGDMSALIRSSRRPGVATTISQPACSEQICGCMPTPPLMMVRQAQMHAVGAEALGDLCGQFAGGCEDQRPEVRGAGRRLPRQALKDRQSEGGGLSGARLGDTQHVAAGKDRRNGLLWIGVAVS